MFKRYSSYSGGTANPLIIHWPRGIKARGEVRHQYHHCTDIMPTMLECCGIKMPDVVDGVRQTRLPGVSMRYSFDNAAAATTKEAQYYEMPGTRGIWHAFKILAEVEFSGDSQGVTFVQGSRFGGHSMFVKGGKLFYVYNFLGIPPSSTSPVQRPSLGRHIVGVGFTKETIGKDHEALGHGRMYVDEEVVAHGALRTQTGHYSLCGEGLCIGNDNP
jgi:hypothetical protein